MEVIWGAWHSLGDSIKGQGSQIAGAGRQNWCSQRAGRTKVRAGRGALLFRARRNTMTCHSVGQFIVVIKSPTEWQCSSASNNPAQRLPLETISTENHRDIGPIGILGDAAIFIFHLATRLVCREEKSREDFERRRTAEGGKK